MNEHADTCATADSMEAPAPPVDLETLRQYRALSYTQLARELGVNHATQARKYALGQAWPTPIILRRILTWGGGRLCIMRMLDRYLREKGWQARPVS